MLHIIDLKKSSGNKLSDKTNALLCLKHVFERGQKHDAKQTAAWVGVFVANQGEVQFSVFNAQVWSKQKKSMIDFSEEFAGRIEALMVV